MFFTWKIAGSKKKKCNTEVGTLRMKIAENILEKTTLKSYCVLKDSIVDVSPHSFPEEGKSE